jgi:hypothetical protein
LTPKVHLAQSQLRQEATMGLPRTATEQIQKSRHEALPHWRPLDDCDCTICQQARVEAWLRDHEFASVQPRDYAPERLDFQNPMQAWSVGKEMLIGALWALATVSMLLMLGIGLGVALYGNWPLRGWVW